LPGIPNWNLNVPVFSKTWNKIFDQSTNWTTQYYLTKTNLTCWRNGLLVFMWWAQQIQIRHCKRAQSTYRARHNNSRIPLIWHPQNWTRCWIIQYSRLSDSTHMQCPI
jgi:hypothetical protein